MPRKPLRSPPRAKKPLANAEIAAAFDEIADLLELSGENPFRIRAYRNGARTVQGLEAEAAALIARGKALSDYPGIGDDLAGKIADLATTGTTPLLEDLRARFPAGLVALLRLPSLGPKRVARLHEKFGIRDAAGLKAAIEAGKLAKLPGFGAKLIETLATALGPAGPEARRYTLAEAAAEAEPLTDYLRRIPGVARVEIAGSYRRGRETVGDVDILAAAAPGSKAIARFVAYPRAAAVHAEGETRAAIRLEGGLQVDLRVVASDEFGAALYYFTGSKAHNIATRAIAVKRKLKINEYGVFRGARRVAGETEESVFAAIGLPYIPPELREARGEIEAARDGTLPKLVESGDLRGDLCCRSDAGGGRDGLEALAVAARKRKLAYIAIADPCRRVASANRLDPAALARQGEAIDRLNEAGRGLTILKGVEVAIRADGSLDLPDSSLAGLDFVLAAVQDGFDLPAAKQTARLLRALDGRRISILGRPTGRLFPSRPPMQFDMARILAAAKARGCFLGLDARPDRLDLPDIFCRSAKEAGLRIAIGSGAGSAAEFGHLRWGVLQARRGWLEKADVLNTAGAEQARSALRQTMI